MANCNGSDAGTVASSYVPVTPPAGSEAVDSGKRRSSEGDTGFQGQHSSLKSESSSLDSTNIVSSWSDADSSSSGNGSSWRTNININADMKKELQVLTTSTTDLESPDSEEDLKFSSQSDSTTGEARQSAEQILQQAEDSKKMESLKICLGHCIGDAKKSITAFEEEEKEDLGARYNTTTATQKQKQQDMDVNAERVTNMRLKHIYSLVYYSILLVLETLKKSEMKQAKTWTDMYARVDDSLDVYAERILQYMKTMRVHTLPFHKYPKPKDLIGLRNAAAHANISYQIWCDNKTAIVELLVQTYQQQKDYVLQSVYRCTYEDLCIICKDIRIAFLKCLDVRQPIEPVPPSRSQPLAAAAERQPNAAIAKDCSYFYSDVHFDKLCLVLYI